MQIIIKKYEHVNKAFGNWDSPNGRIVKNKDHYDRIMKEEGYITYEQSQQEGSKNKIKPYVPSKKALDIIKSVKHSSHNGKVKLSDRTIDALKDIGAIGREIKPYMKNKEYAQGFSI